MYQSAVGFLGYTSDDVCHILSGAAARVVKSMNDALLEGFDELFSRVSVEVFVVFIRFRAWKIFSTACDEISISIDPLELKIVKMLNYFRSDQTCLAYSNESNAIAVGQGEPLSNASSGPICRFKFGDKV